MIHTTAVSDRLLQLLQDLMQEDLLRDFHLVGGTALALRFGHRESIDVDLFTIPTQKICADGRGRT